MQQAHGWMQVGALLAIGWLSACASGHGVEQAWNDAGTAGMGGAAGTNGAGTGGNWQPPTDDAHVIDMVDAHAHDAATPSNDGAIPGVDASVPCVRGATAANEVVMIGDSFFHITEIPQRLWTKARAAGSLGASEAYRYYYVSGAMMAAMAFATPIPDQYEQARTADPNITYVVMNGGGNDVLIGDRSCLLEAPPSNAACAATIDNAIATTKTLFARMASDGVEQIVFTFYPHMPTFGLFQGNAPAINDTIDYAERLARQACEESVSPPCTFVSTIAAFEGHPEYLNAGDVHASPAGSEVAADLIWNTMVDHCIAQ